MVLSGTSAGPHADTQLWRARVRPATAPESALSQRLIGVAATALLLVVWELLARVGLLEVRFFPPPTQIVRDLFEPGNLRLLGEATLVTLYRVSVGFSAGVLAGAGLGIVAGLNKYLRAAVQPLIGAVYPIPKIAVLPLIILIFGLGNTSLFVVVFIGVFFPMLMNTIAGVHSIDRIYIDVAKNVKASPLRVFRTVALPGALPGIMTGVRVSWGMALLIIIGSEFIAAKSGIGYHIYYSWQTFSVTSLWGGLVLVSVLGICSFAVIDALERLIIPWRRS